MFKLSQEPRDQYVEPIFESTIRLRLLQKGASWESDRGDGRGDNADAEEEADDIACDVFDAVPDPALRQRLEEVRWRLSVVARHLIRIRLRRKTK
jgi:hypothetical protein